MSGAQRDSPTWQYAAILHCCVIKKQVVEESNRHAADGRVHGRVAQKLFRLGITIGHYISNYHSSLFLFSDN